MLATPFHDEERVCDTSPFPFCLYLSLLCKIYNLLSAKMWVFHRDNGWRVKERRCSSRKQYKKRTATFFLSLLTSKIACFIPCGRKRTICNCVLQVLVPGNKNVCVVFDQAALSCKGGIWHLGFLLSTLFVCFLSIHSFFSPFFENQSGEC